MANPLPRRMDYERAHFSEDYILLEDYPYYSARYRNHVILEKRFVWDGATAAIDLEPEASGVHDWLCGNYRGRGPEPPIGQWHDGTKLTNWQASVVYRDILRATGHSITRSNIRMFAVFFGGGTNIKRINGWV